MLHNLQKFVWPSYAAEVVVAPAFIHIPLVQSNLRREIAVSAQNCWLKGNGAYTGEVRSVLAEFPYHSSAMRLLCSSVQYSLLVVFSNEQLGIVAFIVRLLQLAAPTEAAVLGYCARS